MIVALRVAVDIDRCGVFRQILIVGAPAMDVFAGQPFAQVLEVFFQPVLQHLRAGRQRLGLTRRFIALAQVERQQHGFEGAVVKRISLVRMQLHGAPQLYVSSQNGRAPASEARAQRVAHGAIELRHFGAFAQPLAIRWIGDDQAIVDAGRRRDVHHVLLVQREKTRHAGFLRIAFGRLYHARVGIAAEEHAAQSAQASFGALIRLVQQPAPERDIVLLPAEKAEILTTQAGRHVGRHQGAFYQQSAGAAHRIEQCAAGGIHLGPARAQQHCRGEIFLQRCLTLHFAPAAPMQRRTSQIQRHRRAIAAQPQIDPDVRFVGVDAGPSAIPLTELIDHRVLHPQADELAVGKLAHRRTGVHRERGVRG